MKRSPVLLVLALLAGAAPALAADLVVHRDFAGGTFAGWSLKRLKHKDSAVIEQKIVRTGRYAARITLRPGDNVSDGWRAELTDPYNAPVGEVTWYSFSTYIPKDYPVGEDNICVLAQWHDQADPGQNSHKPMLAQRFNRGEFYVTHDGAGIKQQVLYSDPHFALGAWHDFAYRIRWSKHEDGFIEGWIDGRKVIDFKGVTLYPSESRGPYFKFGVYCAHDVATPHTVYDDNFARGQGTMASVADLH